MSGQGFKEVQQICFNGLCAEREKWVKAMNVVQAEQVKVNNIVIPTCPGGLCGLRPINPWYIRPWYYKCGCNKCCSSSSSSSSCC